jgi:Cytochrome P450/Berberine and berberine like
LQHPSKDVRRRCADAYGPNVARLQDVKRRFDPHQIFTSATRSEGCAERMDVSRSATMAREVVKEPEINGCRFKAGEMVMLSFPAVNRDPEMFPDADRVIIDRSPNRHAAFGLGIHRCIGSNLARMEMIVALGALSRSWVLLGTSKNIRLRRDDRRLKSPRCRINGRRPFIEAIFWRLFEAATRAIGI